LLFLALISYNPKDLPSWVPWSYFRLRQTGAKFHRAVGAILAGFCYLTLGAASYCWPVFSSFLAARNISCKPALIARLPWSFSSSRPARVLFQLQTGHLQGWKHAFNFKTRAFGSDTFLENASAPSMGQGRLNILLSAIYVRA